MSINFNLVVKIINIKKDKEMCFFVWKVGVLDELNVEL